MKGVPDERTNQKQISFTSDQPGCYLMKDKMERSFMSAKAKILKNRVRSIFYW